MNDNHGYNSAEQDYMLDEKVAFLSEKQNYPHATSDVKAVKTHMSWVFLTDSLAYKLKIPFRYNHMRLRSVSARRKNCEDEVRLNKRLANEVYLGIVPLSITRGGKLTLGEGAETVDWLVKMKRLPDSMMLSEKIKTGEHITESQLQPAVERLTRFYLQAMPIQMQAERNRKKITAALRSYREQLLSPEFSLNKKVINFIFDQQLTFLENNRALFNKRTSTGKIIEGHGDLKPEHICLSPPAIIDCLEFDKELRILDIYDDLAFLCLECDKLKVPWVGTYITSYYAKRAEDFIPSELLNFYKSYKAFTRALLSINHLKEKQYRQDPKWEVRTKTYLTMASRYMQSHAL